MIIHPKRTDSRGAGRWNAATGRYVPMFGGSRSRLPIADSSAIRRYHGYVGVDERLSEDLDSVTALYRYMGGAPLIPEGPAGEFMSRIYEESQKWVTGGGDDD